VDRLLTRLIDLRDVEHGDEHRDQRAGCIHELMQFYKEINRDTMYERYIYKLSDIYIKAKMFSEAAATLQLHAERFSWTDEKLEPYHDSSSPEHPARYPAQLARERKSQIYRLIIDYYDQGNAWERALPLCKELQMQYETEVFDYKSLKDILETMARFYDRITQNVRQIPQYFRVGYWGRKFPTSIRNKEFVYRVPDNRDHIGVFCDRIQNQFPQAQLMMHNKPIGDDVRTGDEMFCQICKVSPLPKPNPERFKHRRVQPALSAYYDMSEVDHFIYMRPFHKGEKTENEFETLWTERVTIVTCGSLPSQQNRVMVVRTEKEEMSPVENAVKAIVDKNTELRQIIQDHYDDRTLSINPLSMILNGVIDAAVQGGTEKYRQAFFNDKYIAQYPDHGPHIEQLKKLLVDQVEILELGVKVHGMKCPESLKPMQEKLETQLEQMKGKSGSQKPSTPHK
jgi:hypothetical protein